MRPFPFGIEHDGAVGGMPEQNALHLVVRHQQVLPGLAAGGQLVGGGVVAPGFGGVLFGLHIGGREWVRRLTSQRGNELVDLAKINLPR